jgi:hypothetical protein
VPDSAVSETTTQRTPADAAVWQNLQDAILQDRFDDLPELMSAMDFAEFAAEPIELIRDAIRSGDIVATKSDGLLTIPKEPNERLIRYRLREDPSARVMVEQVAHAEVRRLSTHIDQSVFELVVDLVANSGISVREVVEEALISRWGACAPEGTTTTEDRVSS